MNLAGAGAIQEEPGGNGVTLGATPARTAPGDGTGPPGQEPDHEVDVDSWIAELRAELTAARPGGDEETDLMGCLAAAIVERYESRTDPADADGAADLDEAIDQLNLVLSRCPPGHESRAEALFIAAAARYHRAFVNDDPADLDVAVANLTEVAATPLTGTDDGDDLPLDVLALFGQALLLRYRVRGSDFPDLASDLSRAIRLHALVCERLDEDDPVRPGWVADLGELYYDRYRLTAAGELPAAAAAGPAVGDLTRAIERYRWLRDAVGDDPALLAESSMRLGLFLAERVLLWGNAPADVTEAIDALGAARQLLAPGDDRLLPAGAYLGIMLGARFTMHGGATQDRTDGIAALREVLASYDHSAAQEAGTSQETGTGRDGVSEEVVDLARVWLGQLLLIRTVPGYSPMGLPALGIDLAEAASLGSTLQAPDVRAEADEAVRHLSLLTSVHTASVDGRTVTAAPLGCALLIRGAGGLPTEDLDRVAECFGVAVAEVAPGDQGAAELIAVHAWVLAEQATRPGRARDFDPVIQRLERARSLLPEGHVLRPIMLHHLGVMLGLRGSQRTSPDDLAAGIAALTEALEKMPEGYAIRAETLSLLAAALLSSVQFSLTGLPIDKVIALLTEARSITQPDPAKRAIYAYSYGCALHIRAIRQGSRDDFSAAVDAVKDAVGLVPREHKLYTNLLFALASMLSDRYSYLGDLEALEAAEFYLKSLIPVLEQSGAPAHHIEGVDLCSARAIRGGTYLHLGLRREDPAALDVAIADLRFALDGFPPESPWRGRLTSELGTALALRAMLGKDWAGFMAAWPRIIEALGNVPAAHPDHAPLAGRAGAACIAQAWMTRDRALLDRGIGLLTGAATDPGMGPEDRARLMWGLGFGHVHRYDLTRARADLDAGVECLEQARQLLAAGPGNPAAAQLLALLAEAYHKRADRSRGDAQRTVEVGLAALREQAANVLLQTGTERGLLSARIGAADAAEVASWSLEVGDPDAAVEALELGRGLVLHAATITTSVPAVLSATGHADLARAWEELHADGAAAGSAPWDGGLAQDSQRPDDQQAPSLQALLSDLPGAAAPSDLRRRVLAALTGSVLDQRLLSPPSRREIGDAMRATGTDAVVYLVPAGEQTAGRALVLTPNAITAVPLPRLKADPGGRVAAYARAHDALVGAGTASADDPAVQRARERWNAALRDLCAWAWRAAMQSVLDAVDNPDPGRPVRLTLVPFGMLGMVPWHAASGRGATGRMHYACEQAVFSYAASGRQLVASAARPALPAQASPVFVDPPVGGSIWSHWEAKYIRDTYYRHGRCLGAQPPDEATVDGVLNCLPSEQSGGASLLHLSCHASSAASSAASHLRLSGDKPLAVDRILRQAQFRRPDQAGGLVVLSACVSDLSMRDYDEALTLVTAFAATGAASVVGTRWLVPDARTALLMFMFHHYLASGRPPGGALRLAQLWMLDPQRAIPDEMPRMFADEVPREDLGDPAAWAGFVHMGR